MIVRPAGGTGCDGCDPYTTLIMRLEALEERANAIVKSVQGILPDGVGNVTLDTESDTTDPSWGATTKLATGSLVKEVYQENHNYIAAVADDVVDLLADVSELQTQVEDLDPTIVSALQQSVAALQQSVNTLSNTVAGYSAVISDLEDQMPNKVDRTGDTMTGPLNVIDTVTGSRNTQAVNGNRLQNDLDTYASMVRTSGNTNVAGVKFMLSPITRKISGDTSENGFTSPFVSTESSMLDNNDISVDGATITRESTNVIWRDWTLRSSTDGTNSNRSDIILRIRYDSSTKTATASMYLLIYANGSLVGSGSTELGRIQVNI